MCGRLSLLHVFQPNLTLFSKLTFYHSRWQVPRVKQETLTLQEHQVPHSLQGTLNCVGCSLA